MRPLDEETLRAVTDLCGNPNFEKIRKWIRESKEEVYRELAQNTIFNAGRLAEIEDLINRIDTSREKYEQLVNQKRILGTR